MSVRERKNKRREFSIERAYQAMDMRKLSRKAVARNMGLINGGKYIEINDDIGCYKGLSKALTDGLISDEMLDRFCRAVNVDKYVISGEADRDLDSIYGENSLFDFKKNLDLDQYPYNGCFPKFGEEYIPEIFSNDGLIGAYEQLMNYFGVIWTDIDENSKHHGKGYYDLMNNILSAITKCILEFSKEQQSTLVYKRENIVALINNFRLELYENGLLD